MDSYRSLVAWQLAHELALIVLRALNIPYRGQTHPLFDQLRRAVVSIEANIVEGYALDTTAYLAKHLRIAIGSAAECECLLRTAHELGWLPPGLFETAYPVADRCIASLRGYLNKTLSRAPFPRTAHRAAKTTGK